MLNLTKIAVFSGKYAMGSLPAHAWQSNEYWPELSKDDYELLDTLECPPHLPSLELRDEVWTAFDRAHTDGLIFLLEQSCDASGRLLIPDIMKSRLQHAPLENLSALALFLCETPPAALAQAVYFIFWLVRFARGRYCELRASSG